MPKLYYFQAPNFSINAESETAPKLGSIFYSLSRLTGPLNQVERLEVPPALLNETASPNFKEAVGKGVTGAVGINANLAQGIAGSADIVYGFKKGKAEIFQCELLETREFEPTEQFIADSIAASARVKATLSNALPGRKRVYMVTGLKIATGLSTSILKTTQHGPILRVGLDATALGIPAGVGPSVELGIASARRVSSGRSENRVVFAYRVVRIKQKRDRVAQWKYKDGGKYALNNDDSDEQEEMWDVERLDEDLVNEEYPDSVKIVME